MYNHPLVLLTRFLLELSALGIYAWWGWHQSDGFVRYLTAIGLPIFTATIWGAFRVPGDQGKGVVPVSGWIRLLVEFLFFGSAIWMLFEEEADRLGWIILIITVLLYLISYERIIWLTKQ
mgnify:CR=1 FL=1